MIGKVKWDRRRGRPEPIAALNKVAELENGEPLVDMRVACPAVVIHRPQVIPYVRQRVAAMLEEVARHLPPGVSLGVIDAFRPFERQVRIYEFMESSAREAFPHLTHAQLRRRVCRWVAPVDQKAPPGHCTGAAIDVQLIDDQGEVIDVWAPFERYQAAPTYTLGLTAEAERYRTLLVETMLGVGFSNCRDEWWHYSFGDAGWAVRMGLNECCYGIAHLDPHLYEEQERLWMEAFRDRTNPFIAKEPDDETNASS